MRPRVCHGTFRAARGGATAVEFALIAPILIAFVFAVFEAGWMMTQSIMLDRGVDEAVRKLRIGEVSPVTQDDVRTWICKRAAILKNCANSLIVELTTVASAADFPADTARCVNRTTNINPVVTFQPGARSSVVLMRVCFVVEPFVPHLGYALQMPKDDSGAVRIISQTAFVNEPE